VIGTALLVAACAGGVVRQTTSAAARWLPLLMAALLAAVIAVGGFLGLRQSEAQELLADARQAMGHPSDFPALAEHLGLAPETQPRSLIAAAGLRAWTLADGAPGLRLQALQLMPASPEVTALAERLAQLAPHDEFAALHLAERLLADRRREEAVREAERAAVLAPTSPRVLDRAADLLRRAAEGLPTQAAALRQRVEMLHAEAERLRPLVDHRLN
jgi:hypothetical protein